MNEQLKHYLQPIVDQGLVSPENAHLLSGHLQLIIDDYDVVLDTVVSTLGQAERRIAELERQLAQRTGRVHESHRQINAVLQKSQHDLMWA